MPFIGPLIVFQTLVLTCRCIPNAKGALFHRHRICNPLLGMSELSVNCALLKGENRSNQRDIATPVYLYIHIYIYTSPLSNLIEIASLPLSISLYYLLLIFPVNEISTARFFTDASFSTQMDFILRLIEREMGKKKTLSFENISESYIVIFYT